MERKLASVRRIAAIDPIEGADKIECVTVDGWKLVSNKENNFQVGQLVIYFEIDSFLPVREEFEWLRKSSFKDAPGIGQGFRIKTIKLRGQVSQGLIVPMADFLQQDGDGNWFYTKPHIYPDDNGVVRGESAYYVNEGDDLTEFLNVKKYEKPIPANMQGRTKGNFPSFIRKTDEERVQNNWGGVKKWIFFKPDDVKEISGPEWVDPSIVTFQSDGRWFAKYPVRNDPEVIAERSRFEMTIKLDGSSLTLYHKDGQIGVCSRNLELQRDPSNPFWAVALQTGILKFLIQDGRNVAVQGELMGPGVQGNREGFKNLSYWIFNVFDIDQQRYMTPRERNDWYEECYNSKDLNDLHQLYHAPVLGSIDLTEETTVQDFLDMADRQRSVLHDIAEGIVFKSYLENGPSFKAISNKFLLKEAD